MRGLLLVAATCSFALASTPAIAAKYVLKLMAQPQQTSRIEDGRGAVDDATATSSVRIVEPREATPKQSGFQVYVLNASGKQFNFGPEDVTIRLADGTAVPMLSYEELLRKEKHREMWQAIGAGLAAASRNMSASQAGYNYGTATYSGNAYGTYGSTPFSANTYGTSSYSGYDAGAAYAAQANANAQNQRDLQALQLNQAAHRQDLDQVMKTTTVDTGQSFGGIVQYLIPKEVRSSKEPIPITIEVRTGDDVHTFQGTLVKN